MELVFLDTETTGLEPNWHEIVEICAIRSDVRIDQGSVVIEYIAEAYGRVKPVHIDRASEYALEINGYDPQTWLDAEPWRKVCERVRSVVDGAPIVGSNPAFDIAFIRESCTRDHTDCGWITTRHAVDTASLAHPLLLAGKIKSVSLGALIDYYGIDADQWPAHTSIGDVHRTMAVYAHLVTDTLCTILHIQ